MSRTLVLVDSTFRANGHYRTLAATVSRTAARRGVEFEALVPVGDGLAGVESPERYRTVLPHRDDLAPWGQRLGCLRRLVQALLARRWAPGSVVYWPSPMTVDLMASVVLMLRYGRRLRQVLVPHFHPAPRGKRQPPGIHALRWGQKWARWFGIPWEVWAPSPAFQEEFNRCGVSGLEVVPTVIINWPQAVSPPATDLCRLAFLGHARDVKGFPLFIESLYELRQELTEGRLQALVQVTGAREEGGASQAAAARLSSDPLPGVTLFPGHLSTEEYGRVLEQSHLVVLPYDPRHYSHYPSAVLDEAFAAGRPVLSTRGTLAGRHVEATGCGLTFDYTAAGALTECVREALSRLPNLLQAAWSNREAWTHAHSMEHYFATVLRL